MRKIAIIATDDKLAESFLVRVLTRSGHETITINPDQEIIRQTLNKIKKRKGDWEISCYIEKNLADWTRSIAKITGLQAEVEEIISAAETQARIELANLWG
jgi:hypothetical protein